ncbi:hypothetical protein [Lactococcus lactis]|uniref:hypothetical protein n=1 Tax=Lactococcus lactis TaxID=1358 RepID=UPI00024D901B|nr:hypothetical protein [Lactococcus lactis]BAL51593.1 hypothetical protein lilo_1596 [Lactococcus lactis subsp. lactis IO-1]
MTKKTKKYTLTAQDIQAYLCELGIKPTKEVSIYSIEYYFDKQTVSTDKLSVEKLQEQLNTARYFFKNILDVNPNLKKGSYVHLSNCVNVMKNSAEKALAAIGGDDD